MRVEARLNLRSIRGILRPILLLFGGLGAALLVAPGRDAVAVDPAQARGAAEAGAGVPAGWQARVQRDVLAKEYEITWQAQPLVPGIEPSWHAPNRAHGFRTYFTQQGSRVVPRVGGAPAWTWGLALVGYGRGGAIRPVGEARLSPVGNRIDYHRDTVEEWYENTAAGLEHGFVLIAAPEAAGEQGDVHLDLALWGNLSPIVAAGGQVIDFVTARGERAVRYANLVVTDARGRLLHARMEGLIDERGRGIRLVVNDEGASYPLTIDPLATSPVWAAAGGQAGAHFAVSVGTAADVNGDGYDDLIVGADLYDNGQMDEGRAFVYFGSAAGPASIPSWSAESNQPSALFGGAVATAGDVNGDGYGDIVIGAILYDNGQMNEGRAFVYLGSATGPASAPAWTAEGDQETAFFGRSAGAAGDVNSDGYGDLVVSAQLYDNGEADEGRAFVYLGSASGLSATPAWTAESDQAEAYFGTSAGTAGDANGDGYSDIIVGAFFYDNGEVNEGRAFVYLGSASGLSATPAWTAESDQANAQFGGSVGTAGDVNGDGYSDLIVGSSSYTNGEFAEGRAWVFLGSPSGPASQAAWTAESNQSGSQFGASVGTAGDVNGDGYADVVVGAYLYDNGEDNEGRAFVYLGGPSGPALTPLWTTEGDQTGAFLGASVGTAGDVNGDGYADVIVAAYQYTLTQLVEGRAFVFLGSASGPAQTAGWSAEGDQVFPVFGASVGTAGDVNGDGYADIIVGAYLFDNGQDDEGRAFLYLGSPSGPALTPSWTAESDQAGALFGYTVATAGDVNGDGYADIIAGAIGYDNGEQDEGRAFVYLGSPSGPALVPAWTAEGDHVGATFPDSAGTAGDVNGDGFADVIVGARNLENDQVGEGRAFVYHGSAAGLSATPAWAAEGDQVQASFGISVGTAGDVNGDGYSDVIVGADMFDALFQDAGRALVYLGSASGLSPAPAWTAEGDEPVSKFGHSVGTAGDVNGDGYADVIVGAHDYYDFTQAI
jgi:hypothetical protein